MSFSQYFKKALEALDEYEKIGKLSTMHSLVLGENLEPSSENIELLAKIGLQYGDDFVLHQGENLFKIAALTMLFFMHRDDQLSFPIFVNSVREGVIFHYESEVNQFALETLLVDTTVKNDIFKDFLKTLRNHKGKHLMSIEDVMSLIGFYVNSYDLILALHDYTMEAKHNDNASVKSYHFTNEFFEKNPINFNLQHHLLLLQLAKEQRIDTQAFELIYNTTKKETTL
jgi:hypothetical protein